METKFKNGSATYKGWDIMKGKSANGTLYYAVNNPKISAPAFICGQLSVAKKFIDRENK